MSESDLTPQEPGADKITNLADANVGDLVDGLTELTLDELNALAAAEAEGKNRSTALAAIEREIQGRVADADGQIESEIPNIDGDASTYANMLARDVDPAKLVTRVLTIDGWVLPRPRAEAEG